MTANSNPKYYCYEEIVALKIMDAVHFCLFLYGISRGFWPVDVPVSSCGLEFLNSMISSVIQLNIYIFPSKWGYIHILLMTEQNVGLNFILYLPGGFLVLVLALNNLYLPF